MSDYHSPFNFVYATMGYMKDLELVFRGHINPEPHGKTNLSRNELVERDKNAMLERVRMSLQSAASTFNEYRKASDSDLKAAQRRFQQTFDEIPPDFDDQVFALWRVYINDALRAIND